ncbi:MAG: discoidin domain-containing protein [Verrucomicrobiales bacterium]|nr:discoidin domain-containing protein [Verrucomicrobiales bacterium]
MDKREMLPKALLAGVVLMLPALALSSRAQTTPNVTVEILGVGAESLLGGDLTDPENDGEDALDSFTSPTWNWTEITSSHEPNFEGGEFSFNIFDNKVGGGNDKWCCDDPTVDAPVWVSVKFAQPVSLTHFTVTSGNDSPDRDPTDWAIQGSSDGTTYVNIYRFTDTTVPWTERNQVAKFTLPTASAPFSYLRYIAWETPGSLHQLNEVEYFGVVGGGGLPDADKDGMPDSYEVEMGFNPNDAADAAQDFDGDGVSNLNEYKAGTNPIDVTKPTLVSSATSGTFNSITLTFSEEVDPSTATNVANYAIAPSLAITGASYKSKVVTLTTAAQAPGATAYTVSITGVTDTSKNAVAAGTQAKVYSYLLARSGVLRFAYWSDIAGTAVDALYGDERYPASPTGTGALFSANSRDYFPTDGLENYGAIMEGFLTPKESGSYRFFIYSDDASELLLSTDATEANLVSIAQETSCCNNFTEPGDHTRTSEPIALTAGNRYYIRMVYKEGGGGDYGQIAWRKEGDTTPAGTLTPIPGSFLSAAVDLPVPADGVFSTRSPGVNAKGVAANASLRIVHLDGKSPWTAENVTLKLDGTAVTPTFVKDGAFATITYVPSALLLSKSTHTVALTYPDAGGTATTVEWSFEVAEYPTLGASHQAVSFDNTKPGFIWKVFQNETFTHTSLKQTEDALAGKLMNGTTPVTENLADLNAIGVASGAGVVVNNLVKFEIPTVINLSQAEGEANGNFVPDQQMPGIPGLNGSTDGVDAEVVAFVELPAGVVTMGVNSDDGFRAQAGYINVPADGAILGQFDGGRGASDTLFTFVVGSAGVYPLRVIWNEGGGGANIEIFSVKANGTKALLNDTANGGFKTYRVGVAPNKPAAAPTISVARTGTSVVLTFQGTLEVADSITGPWTPLAGTSPLTVPATEAKKFARSKF